MYQSAIPCRPALIAVHGVVRLGGVKRLAEPGVELGVVGEEGILFGLEVPEEGAAGHPGGADDLVDGHALEAAIEKEPEGSVGDLSSRSGFVALPQGQALEIPHGAILPDVCIGCHIGTDCNLAH